MPQVRHEGLDGRPAPAAALVRPPAHDLAVRRRRPPVVPPLDPQEPPLHLLHLRRHRAAARLPRHLVALERFDIPNPSPLPGRRHVPRRRPAPRPLQTRHDARTSSIARVPVGQRTAQRRRWLLRDSAKALQPAPTAASAPAAGLALIDLLARSQRREPHRAPHPPGGHHALAGRCAPTLATVLEDRSRKKGTDMTLPELPSARIMLRSSLLNLEYSGIRELKPRFERARGERKGA